MDPASVVRGFVDACWNRGDETVARDLCVTEVADRMLAWARRVRLGGPDVSVVVDVLTANDEGWVGTLQTREQTHTGPLTGPLVDQLTRAGEIAATGRRLRSQAAVFYRVTDGKIIEVINVADNLTFFSSFGRLSLEL